MNDGAVCHSRALAAKTARQQLNKRTDGGHRKSARGGIDVLHFHAVNRVDRSAARKFFQRFAAAPIRIRKYRAGAGSRGVIYRQHVHAIALQCIAFGLRRRLNLLRVTFGETGIQRADQRDVQAIHPDHRHVAGVAVIVPSPRRSDNEIPRTHGDAFTTDGSVSTFAFDHKAQRRLSMAMGRRDFAGQDQLQAAIERVGDRRRAA